MREIVLRNIEKIPFRRKEFINDSECITEFVGFCDTADKNVDNLVIMKRIIPFDTKKEIVCVFAEATPGDCLQFTHRWEEKENYNYVKKQE